MEYILFLLLIVGGQPALTTATFGHQAACLSAARRIELEAERAGIGVAALCLPRESQRGK